MPDQNPTPPSIPTSGSMTSPDWLADFLQRTTSEEQPTHDAVSADAATTSASSAVTRPPHSPHRRRRPHPASVARRTTGIASAAMFAVLGVVTGFSHQQASETSVMATEADTSESGTTDTTVTADDSTDWSATVPSSSTSSASSTTESSSSSSSSSRSSSGRSGAS